MNQSERRIVLIRVLLNEHPEYQELRIPTDADTQRQLLRGLLNIREPRRIDTDFLQIQDEYLQEETAAKGITDAADLVPLQPGLYLWQGDITTLKCDAIVNAANSGMTGCYCPNHGCIDNAIHTYAGVQLRLACAEIMDRQRHPEPTGQAKITTAFNLPCQYVLHTVGPIIGSQVTDRDKALLASCYRSALTLAVSHGCRSVDFPSISTGVYGYPVLQAAHVALKAIMDYLREYPDMEVRMVCHGADTLHAYQVVWNMLYQDVKPHED